MIIVMLSIFYFVNTQTPKEVLEYMNSLSNDYEITVRYEDEFEHYIFEYNQEKMEVIYDSKAEKIINVVILDDNFRKCLDND